MNHDVTAYVQGIAELVIYKYDNMMLNWNIMIQNSNHVAMYVMEI